jgi:hypothetical protein
MDRIKHYTDMEARYRKQADTEPATREKYIAHADAWRRLAETRSFVFAKQKEFAQQLAAFDR